MMATFSVLFCVLGMRMKAKGYLWFNHSVYAYEVLK